ncbi:hypothetical protein [Pseudoprimorskyibacter insulae]|uniref:Uncharacterized protein n=1 Tax=Pseudoprimorskyibacter insulae TaxID=1695997 RepID=A0A2R8AWD0_9RHOB|nr:hypothetical protein [Pseudoprimorskyibacter insulae]SPF80345.1 hypothetical protein PRI8871_02150 [Pseudoprimorskyibacter insulae]
MQTKGTILPLHHGGAVSENARRRVFGLLGQRANQARFAEVQDLAHDEVRVLPPQIARRIQSAALASFGISRTDG